MFPPMPLQFSTLTAVLLVLFLFLNGANANAPAPAPPAPAPIVAPIKKYTFNVTNGLSSPDCYSRQVLLVNGELSPTIDINQGDILEVRKMGWVLKSR